MVWAPSLVLGIARELIVAVPAAPALEGEPVRAVLASSRYPTPSFPANPASEPVVARGSGAPNSVVASDSVAAAIVAMPLFRPSAPRQFVASTGVTVYFHEPAGTPLSRQLVAATVPVHPDSVV